MNLTTYTRRAGKQLTYEIEVTVNSYAISLNGKVLKQSGPFAAQFGDVAGSEAMLVHAMSAIENLSDMVEE